jgi:hypothetical protein
MCSYKRVMDVTDVMAKISQCLSLVSSGIGRTLPSHPSHPSHPSPDPTDLSKRRLEGLPKRGEKRGHSTSTSKWCDRSHLSPRLLLCTFCARCCWGVRRNHPQTPAGSPGLEPPLFPRALDTPSTLFRKTLSSKRVGGPVKQRIFGESPLPGPLLRGTEGDKPVLAVPLSRRPKRQHEVMQRYM